MSKINFESLILSQSQKLHAGEIEQFIGTWNACASELLEFYGLDRLTVYPNSPILLRDQKTLSSARETIPPLHKSDYLSDDDSHLQYLRLLQTKSLYRVFDEIELATSSQYVLKRIFRQGGRWHAIIPLCFFAQPWGAISLTNFERGYDDFTETLARQIKMVAEMWLCYWQHADLRLSLHGNAGSIAQESDNERLVKLTLKQTTILSLLAQGKSAKECGELLHLSPRTIESHKYRMQIGLGLDSKAELIQFALRNGLGSPLKS
ncbi:LuxR C-terminal-related transcriptional regulator [Vibrio mediterranei]|uniref:helix-turn-helix transcriptional regulator n=1 Tax=Vibrio mediterranei TaxID=689 RepID=UPI00148DDC69|nr:LuxR C-terminal-related transcriptional regulator [Vibrio mediterranei]MCG9627042.1 LuxR C-terminal-related transcriptional regulator [Vibrio mediterranei]NOI26055.1 response regulator transcription factor [Vibrio mediterranei]